MLDFELSTHDEVCSALGSRLRAQRLQQLLTQDELARRAGVSLGTVRKLESSGLSSTASAVRIAMSLGLADQLQTLFQPQVWSIAQMERAELAQRQRAPKRPRPAARP